MSGESGDGSGTGGESPARGTDDPDRDGTDDPDRDGTDDPDRDGTGDSRLPPDVPTWEDEYLDRVSDRLMVNYDLAKDRRVGGERFDLHAEMTVHNEKQFLHPVLSFGHHDLYEHLFARRVDGVTVADLEALVELGHDLADDWIDPDEEHYSTDFTFALVAPAVPDDVRSFVAGFKDRTLLKYGYNGHYEIGLVVVAPDRETAVGSENADVVRAFRFWDVDESSGGRLGRLFGRLRS